jgi:S-DNA-T family DNA segregation ATPase FtsK/SpoIIIE
LAVKNKATRRKTSKSPAKTESVERESPSFGRILLGYFLIILGALLLVSCFCPVYVSSDGRGANALLGIVVQSGTFLLGRLPLVFFTVALVLWGLLALGKQTLRYALGMTLLTCDLSALMSLKIYDLENVSRDVLAINGGILGQFLKQYVFIALFGKTGIAFPLVFSLLFLVAILVLCFGLRARHLAFVWNAIRGLKRKKEEGSEEGGDDDGDEDETSGGTRVERKGISMDGDTTIFQVPDAYRTKHKGVLKPFSARKNWMEAVDTTAAETPMVDRVVEGTLVEGSFGTVAEKPAPKPLGEDPEILRLEKELRENGTHMSALEIREIRNKIAEIRRAREEINWENERQGNLVVKGAVRGGESETTDEATVVAGAAPDEATVVAGSVEETQAATVAKTMAGNEESTQVGDAEPSAESDEDEEDFIPQVVSSDEVDQDPSYVPPSNIGTSSGGTTVTGSGVTGIPQPDPTVHYDEYKVPSVDEILDTHEPQPADYTVDELNAIGKMLEEKLENFKVKGKVVG